MSVQIPTFSDDAPPRSDSAPFSSGKSSPEILPIDVVPKHPERLPTASRDSKKNVDETSSLLDGLRILEKYNEIPSKVSFESRVTPGVNLLADPNAVWYVQLQDGPQYGPVTGAVLESWIQERRIAPKTLVWKDGWNDWLEAANVFPEMAVFFHNPRQIDIPTAWDRSRKKGGIETVILSPQFQIKLEKKKKRVRNFVFIVSFFVSSVILLVLLVILLTRSP